MLELFPVPSCLFQITLRYDSSGMFKNRKHLLRELISMVVLAHVVGSMLICRRISSNFIDAVEQ
jgi:hypothetical protein